MISDTETGTVPLQNRHKITATLGLVVHAAGNTFGEFYAQCVVFK